MSEKKVTRWEACRQYGKAYQKWSADDDNLLREQFAQGATIDDLAKALERQPTAIESRLAKIGLIPETTAEAPPGAPQPEPVSAPVDNHKIAALAVFYSEAHQRVYGQPYWGAEKLLLDLYRGHPQNQKLLDAFAGLVKFFEVRGYEVSMRSIHLPSYIEWALDELKMLLFSPYPAKLKNGAMLERWRNRPIPAPPPDKETDYRKLLPFADDETLQWLGLT